MMMLIGRRWLLLAIKPGRVRTWHSIRSCVPQGRSGGTCRPRQGRYLGESGPRRGGIKSAGPSMIVFASTAHASSHTYASGVMGSTPSVSVWGGQEQTMLGAVSVEAGRCCGARPYMIRVAVD